MSTIQLPPALLSASGLTASYGPVTILREISLEVRCGEIVTIIGANGAGKTTLLRCLSCLLKPRAGEIFFDQRDLTRTPAHKLPGLGLAHVPEGRRIFPRLTVYENLELGAYSQPAHKIDPGVLHQVYNLFPILKERSAQLGGTLSGGEQQMLAIGRALMSQPKLLLMDEPSMGVAPIFVEKIFGAISELNRAGVTILLVEQNAHLALEIAARAYVLETGSVALSGPAAELRSDSRIREAYLGE